MPAPHDPVPIGLVAGQPARIGASNVRQARRLGAQVVPLFGPTDQSLRQLPAAEPESAGFALHGGPERPDILLQLNERQKAAVSGPLGASQPPAAVRTRLAHDDVASRRQVRIRKIGLRAHQHRLRDEVLEAKMLAPAQPAGQGCSTIGADFSNAAGSVALPAGTAIRHPDRCSDPLPGSPSHAPRSRRQRTPQTARGWS